MKFKIGQKVEVIKTCDTNKDCFGAIGKILDIESGDLPYRIEFLTQTKCDGFNVQTCVYKAGELKLRKE